MKRRRKERIGKRFLSHRISLFFIVAINREHASFLGIPRRGKNRESYMIVKNRHFFRKKFTRSKIDIELKDRAFLRILSQNRFL